MAEPSEFQKDSFRRIERGEGRDRVSLVIGKRPGKDTTETQAIRYPKETWTAERARTDCQEKGGRFEAAGGGEEMAEAVWIPVFRTGDYGEKGRYTEADLDRLAADYDPALHEAPVVLGHPAQDAPAYGWIRQLRRTGELLEALVQPTVQEFVEWVRQGLFKKVSIALYGKLPQTGRLYLRHLGFLGAMSPEVKGLPPVSFAFDEQAGPFQEVEIAEAVLRQESVERVLRACDLFKDRVLAILNDPFLEKKQAVLDQLEQLRDLVASQEFREAAAAKEKRTMKTFWEGLKALFREQGIRIPDERGFQDKGEEGEGTGAAARAQITRLTDAGMTLAAISEALGRVSEEASRSPQVLAQIRDGEIANPPDSLVQALRSITPPKKEDEMADRRFTEEEVAAREKTAADAAADKARKEAEARHRQAAHIAETKAFVEGLKKEGKFLPAWEEMGLVAVLLDLPAEATISFGEGKDKKSPAAVLRAFLESLPKLVTLEEMAKAGKEAPAAQRDAAALFAANQGIFRQLSVTSEMLAKAAEAEAAKQGGK